MTVTPRHLVGGLLVVSAMAAALAMSRPDASAAQTPSSPATETCAPKRFGNPLIRPMWNGWGNDIANTRFQPAASAGLSAENVPKLTLKWAYGFPDGQFAASGVTVAGGRLFIGAGPGAVYSIDAVTGCTYWTFRTHQVVRTSIVIGEIPGTIPPRYAAYFGDLQANVYAIDAETGSHLWTKRIDLHPLARITASPALHQGRLYVPVSSLEESNSASSTYECCTFRGKVVAVEALTGNEIWRAYTIDQLAEPTAKNSAGTQQWGPAGAAVWNTPTIDAKRGLLYFATGDAYTDPAAPLSDGVVAVDMKTGRRVWGKQLLANDAWISGCKDNRPNNPSANCPDDLGPDFDFAQSVVLRHLANGKDILTIGQKSGVGYGLDPDNKGAVLWRDQVGSVLNAGDSRPQPRVGGLQWGSGADERNVYMAVNDFALGPKVAGGMAAIDMATGKRVWYTRPPDIPCANPQDTRCIQAQSAAVTVVPGVVFSGATNGMMRGYSSTDGKVIWEFDTAREFTTVNGPKARGGRIDGPGPAVVNGWMYLHSGYALTRGGVPGNVLLAFAAN